MRLICRSLCAVVFVALLGVSCDISHRSVSSDPAFSEQDEWNDTLQAALKDTDRFLVRTLWYSSSDDVHDEVLFETSEPGEIAEFVSLIFVDPEESRFHCMCNGNPFLEFYKGDQLCVSLSFHHGVSFRWENGAGRGWNAHRSVAGSIA